MFLPIRCRLPGEGDGGGRKGRDLRPELYGKVECKGDFFKGCDFTGKQVYWDGKTRRHYERMPELGRLGRFELVKQDAAYMFRFRERGLDFSFRKEDVRVSATGKVFIIGKHLIVNDKKNSSYMNFLDSAKECILVSCGECDMPDIGLGEPLL